MNINVVVDFCCKDIVFGGQGVFLVFVYYVVVFFDFEKYCVLVNIGGIVNIMVLFFSQLIKLLKGFDIGLGNIFMDYWIKWY